MIAVAKSREATILRELAERGLPGDGRLTWADLVEQVEYATGVHRLLLLGRERSASVVRARHFLWGLLRGAGYSYNEIAAALRLDHTSVIGGVRSASRRLGICS